MPNAYNLPPRGENNLSQVDFESRLLTVCEEQAQAVAGTLKQRDDSLKYWAETHEIYGSSLEFILETAGSNLDDVLIEFAGKAETELSEDAGAISALYSVLQVVEEQGVSAPEVGDRIRLEPRKAVRSAIKVNLDKRIYDAIHGVVAEQGIDAPEVEDLVMLASSAQVQHVLRESLARDELQAGRRHAIVQARTNKPAEPRRTYKYGLASEAINLVLDQEAAKVRDGDRQAAASVLVRTLKLPPGTITL